MNRLLVIILVLSGLLALGYSSATPIGGAPDETAHVKYVEVLAREHRLPALNIRERRASHNDPDYESHQSALYYTLAVPFYAAGSAIGGPSGAAHACRLLSILIGLVGVALVGKIAGACVPGRPALSLTAAAFTAFLPMRLAILGSVSNDTLAETISSFVLLLLIRAVSGPWGRKQAAWLGVALGLALLSKQSCILLLPPALLGIYLAARAGVVREQADPGAEPAPALVGRRLVSTGAVTLAVMLILSGWWFVRNHLLYGDPLGQRVFNWYFADTPLWSSFRDQLGWSFGDYLTRLVFPTSFATFWGAFGHLDPSHPELFMGHYPPGFVPDGLQAIFQLLWPVHKYPPLSWIYPLLVVISATSMAGGARYLWLRRRTEAPPPPKPLAEARGRTGRGARRGRGIVKEVPPGETTLPRAGPAPLAHAVVATHALFVAAAFLNFNATYFQAQGRYLFPAIAALATALCAGWLEWGRRHEPILGWTIAAAVLCLAVYGWLGVVQPAFQAGA